MTQRTLPLLGSFRGPSLHRLFASATILLLHGALGAMAAESYSESLKAGDAARSDHDSEVALKEYSEAIGQASNDTEHALALGKKSLVYSKDLQKFDEAGELAKKAIKFEMAKPVGRVTALMAMGEYQLKGSKEYEEAAKTLEEARKLKDVDWALPGVHMALGDAYRLSGKFNDAIEAYQRVIDDPNTYDGIKSIAFLNIGLANQYGLKNAAEARKAYGEAARLNEALRSETSDHLGRLSSE